MSDAPRDIAPPPPGQSLPLEAFLDALRREGFAVDSDHYHELPLLLHTLAAEHPYESLKTLLAPLVARNRQEQQRFYDFFDRYYALPAARQYGPARSPSASAGLKLKTPPAPLPKAKRRVPDWLYLVGIGFLVLGLFTGGLVAAVKIIPAAANAATGIIIILVFFILLCLAAFYGFHKIANARLKKGSSYNYGLIMLALLVALFFWAGYYVSAGGIADGAGFAMLALVLFLPLNGYFARRFKKKLPPPPPSPRLLAPLRFPLDVPFPRIELLGRTESFHLSRQLNRRQADTYDTREIDIPATLERTLRNAGIIELAYKPFAAQPHYLLLIDAAHANEHEVEWFDHLLQTLQGDDTRLERYFFEHDPSFCWHERGEAPVPLQNLYGGQRLMMLSDGHLLADLASGGLFNWALDLFSLWADKALLSYRPVEEWGYVEQQLATEFYLAPSTVDGLMEAVDYFENRAEKSLEDWHRDNIYDVLNTDDAGLLSRSLPPEVFEWVCACALHPELHWKLTLHLGELLERRPNGLLNQENLTLLSRLKWFREGQIPEEARKLLVNALSAAATLKVRRALAVLLSKPGSVPPRDSYAYRQYRSSLLRQQFELARQEEDEEKAKVFFRQLQLYIAEQGSTDRELLALVEDEAVIGRYGLPLAALKEKLPPLWSANWRNPLLAKLHWVFYRKGESLRVADYLPERLAAGRDDILLLLPGPGDSRGMVEFARLPYLEGEFGLVLTFEYNRLGQKLEDSARELQSQLQAVGLETAESSLTILADSSGGLIARYYIEHLGGNIHVKHLVMAGTPNGGSSTLQAANRLWKVMESAGSIIPMLGSYFAVLLSRLYLRFFPAYQQIEPGSAFIQSLNPPPDKVGFHSNVLSMQKAVFEPGPFPGVPYSILAGDAEAYYRDKKLSRGERWVLKLAERLYQGQPHDLAASLESMTTGTADWEPQPAVRQVPATHALYFTAEESMRALRELLQRDLSVEEVPTAEEEVEMETGAYAPEAEAPPAYETPLEEADAVTEAPAGSGPDDGLAGLREELFSMIASPEAGPAAVINRLREMLKPEAGLNALLDMLQDRYGEAEKRWLGGAIADEEYKAQSAAIAAELRRLVVEGLRAADLRGDSQESVAESMPPEEEGPPAEADRPETFAAVQALRALRQHLKNLLAKRRIEEVFQLLEERIDDRSRLKKDIILQQAQFNSINKQIRSGLIDPNTANLTLNRISAALLALLDELQADDLQAVREEPSAGRDANLSEDTPSLPARWILASGRVGIAEKPERERISFLQLVLAALKENRERRLSAFDLRDILQLARPTEASYEPTGGPLPEAGDEGGQFFFYDKNELRAAASSKRPQRKGSSGPSGQRGQAWLFVVGISEYRHLPPLPGAARDAQGLVELLVGKYQFEREYLYQFYDAEATRDNILRNLKRIVGEALPEDEVLIVFAGHSDRPPKAEQAYWLPSDAQRGRLATYISREDIFHDLRTMAPRQVLVVVDGEGW